MYKGEIKEVGWLPQGGAQSSVAVLGICQQEAWGLGFPDPLGLLWSWWSLQFQLGDFYAFCSLRSLLLLFCKKHLNVRERRNSSRHTVMTRRH